MGYETERFITHVDEEFLCSICLNVFKDPVNGPCGHSFCSTCIDGWIPVNSNCCPLDKKPLIKKDIIPSCIPFKNLLNRLKLRCDFEKDGCAFVCQLGQMMDHIKFCEFNPDGEVICSEGCDLKYLRKEADSHKCINALKKVVEQQKDTIAELKRKPQKRNYDDLSDPRIEIDSPDPYQQSLIQRYRFMRDRRDRDMFSAFNSRQVRPSTSAIPATPAQTPGSTATTDLATSSSVRPSIPLRSTSPEDATSPFFNADDPRDYGSVRVMLRRLTREQLENPRRGRQNVL
ncbi:E3 ubiquitin-protein ligase NRDP1 [Halotydeus destructor]|nr:E3 ubiquitin-protein ligase NRDP1 [Halotydeus destructor]